MDISAAFDEGVKNHSNTDLSKAFDEGVENHQDEGLGGAFRQTGKAALHHGAQAGTFGFSDELAGALASPSGALKQISNLTSGHIAGNNLNGEEIPQTDEDLAAYKKARDEERRTLEQTAEESPAGAAVGTVGGSLVPGFGASKLFGNLLKGGVISSGLEGATTGALGGIGTSEAETPEELAKDVKSGAVLGGVAGGVLGGVQKGINALQKSQADSEFADLVKKSYREGKEGKGFTGKKDVLGRLKEEKATQENLAQQLQGTEKELGKDISGLLNKATEEGKVIQIESPDLINKGANFEGELAQRPKLLSVESLGFFDKFKAGEPLTPNEANTLRRELRDLANGLDPRNPDGRAIIDASKKLADGLGQEIETQVPGFKEANAKFKQFREAGSETIGAKGLNSEIAGKSISDLNNPTEKLQQDIGGIFKKLSAGGTTGDESKKVMIELQNKLNLFDKQNPGLLKSKGMDVNTFLDTLKGQSDTTAISRAIRGHEPHGSAWKQFFNYFTPKGAALNVANVAGKVSNYASSKAGKLGKNFYNAAPDQLQGLATKLQENEALKFLGSGLEKALANKSDAAKNAALFSISQNPNARQFVKDMGFEE